MNIVGITQLFILIILQFTLSLYLQKIQLYNLQEKTYRKTLL
jgi:hypothetical protein